VRVPRRVRSAAGTSGTAPVCRSSTPRDTAAPRTLATLCHHLDSAGAAASLTLIGSLCCRSSRRGRSPTASPVTAMTPMPHIEGRAIRETVAYFCMF
jgi:hypothetical protein